MVISGAAMAPKFLSLQDTADFLGVHYMTAYRYVRLGLLPARKKAGKWVVGIADVRTFVDRPPAETPRGQAPWTERLQARMMAGDTSGAWAESRRPWPRVPSLHRSIPRSSGRPSSQSVNSGSKVRWGIVGRASRLQRCRPHHRSARPWLRQAGLSQGHRGRRRSPRRAPRFRCQHAGRYPPQRWLRGDRSRR